MRRRRQHFDALRNAWDQRHGKGRMNSMIHSGYWTCRTGGGLGDRFVRWEASTSVIEAQESSSCRGSSEVEMEHCGHLTHDAALSIEAVVSDCWESEAPYSPLSDGFFFGELRVPSSTAFLLILLRFPVSRIFRIVRETVAHRPSCSSVSTREGRLSEPAARGRKRQSRQKKAMRLDSLWTG